MLYFVPTPIGNLADITLRGVKILSEAEIIFCEDTRNFRKLTKLLEITIEGRLVDITKNQKFNFTKVNSILDSFKIKQDHNQIYCGAVVSDAGTPGLSDPGWEIINLAQQKSLKYSILPGANSLIPALVGSGLVSKDFLYLGFLPIKKGRQKIWQEISKSQRPIALLESVHRIPKLLSELSIYLRQNQKICICRELSKKFEEFKLLSVYEIPSLNLELKGEFVIIIAP